MREIHYTFVLKLDREDECFEGEFEDGLTHLLETVDQIDNPEKTWFSVDLIEKVVAP